MYAENNTISCQPQPTYASLCLRTCLSFVKTPWDACRFGLLRAVPAALITFTNMPQASTSITRPLFPTCWPRQISGAGSS